MTIQNNLKLDFIMHRLHLLPGFSSNMAIIIMLQIRGLKSVSAQFCKCRPLFSNFPAVHMLSFHRFSACWTMVTAGIYTVLFLHHSWYKLSIASVGAQSTWLLLTWIFWVTGASLLNSALPTLFSGGSCVTVTYCGQTQTLFGQSISPNLQQIILIFQKAFAILQMYVFDYSIGCPIQC